MRQKAMGISETALRIGISRGYYWAIRSGRNSPSLSLALRIYDEMGERYGVLARLTPEEIEKLR
jgi:transcriptional regulator with XRE-family HTH domain